jgi:teichuronic acid exporter
LTSLSNQARSSVIWNTGFSLFRDGMHFVQMVILARLLVDEDYGRFAVVTSLIGFLSMFSFTPFVAHTLQVEKDADAGFQRHFTSGIVFQVSIFVLTNIIASVLSYFPNYAAISLPVHVMSITFLLEWPTEIRLKMLERAFDWKKRRLLHGVGLIAGFGLAVGLAKAGYGVYALLVPGLLVTIPFICDLFFGARWRPTWEFSWKDYKPAAQFGMARLGSGLTLRGRHLLEASFLAAACGLGPLGILNRAVGLSQLVCGKIAMQLMYAVYPVLARLANEPSQKQRAGNLLMRLVTWSTIPSAFALVWLTPPIVTTIYGPNWVGVIPLVKWTVLSAVAAAVVHVASTLTLANNKPRICLYCDVVALGGTGLALLAALPFGVVPYLIAVFVTHTVNIVILAAVLTSDGVMSKCGIRRAIVPPVIGTAVGALCANAVTNLIIGPPETLLPSIIWGIVFCIAYTCALRTWFSRPLTEIVSFFPAKQHFFRILRLPAV